MDPQPKVTFRQRMGFGAGGAAETFGELSLPTLAQPIFGITFGLSPLLVGIILTVFRIWDGVADPLMGSISDNARTRWGRRKPFIILGAIGGAFAYAAIFFAPSGASETFTFTYFLITCLIFYTFYTIYAVPYQALGFEATRAGADRVSLMAYRGVFYQVAGITVGWMYALAQLTFFENTVQGIRVIAIATGVMYGVFALLPAFLLKERPVSMAAETEKLPFWPSLRSTMSNRPFQRLVLINVLVIVSSQMVTHLGLYLKIFYVFAGDTKAGATVAGIAFTVYQISAIVAVPVMLALSRRFGKSPVLIGALMVMIGGTIIKWFAYHPGLAYLIPVAAFFIAPGNSAMRTILFAIVGEVIDQDEKEHGTRRDGMFVSVFSWVTKFGYSAAGIFSGAVLVLTGFEQALGGAQNPATFLWMRILFVVVPLVSIGCALGLLLTAKRPDSGTARLTGDPAKA